MLMEMLAKPLSGCIAELLSHQAEKHNLHPNTNFGGHPGRRTIDALHLTTKFIFDHWRKGNVVSALFLDIKGVKFMLECDFRVVQIFGVVGCLEVLEIIGCSDGLWLQL